MKYAYQIAPALLAILIGQTLALGENSPQSGSQPNTESAAASKSEGASDWLSILTQQEALTGDWGGLRVKLEDSGISLGLGLTQVYQQNLRGGLSTHSHSGSYAGRYDIELDVDLEKLLNWSGGSIYALGRGGWSDGIDESSVGSMFGTNSVAVGDRPIDLWQLYLQQSFFDDSIFIRVGKIDLTGQFDANMFANDEAGQFLNGSLVNNPVIPFPDPGLGVILHLEPVDWWYISAAIADGDADFREVGFSTAFHGTSNSLGILETGFMPQLPFGQSGLRGSYRIGMWYDRQAKDHFDGAGSESDDIGSYLSVDQMLFKESDNDEDSQGLGMFARCGMADSRVNEIDFFWSIGTQYQGLIPARSDDVIGLGISQCQFSDDAGFSASCETAMELYYNAQITPWLSIAPSVQHISNPGGDETVDNAVVAGLRVQVAF